MNDWLPTPEQRTLLDQQAFVEELVNLRTKQPTKAAEDPKAGWQKFLESTGGAALVTVLLGTLGGAWLTGLIQSHSQDQQTRQLRLSEYVKGEHDVVKSAFDLIGQCAAAAENLSTLTKKEFDIKGYLSGDSQKLILGQKKALRDKFNECDATWRASRGTLTLNMRYFHANDAGLGSAWDSTRDGLTAYIDCERTWSVMHQGTFVEEQLANDACKAQKLSLAVSLKDLSSALENNRLHEWNGKVAD